MLSYAKEACCFTRTYSEIEGLQLAHTLTYSASALAGGVVLELRLEQGSQSCVSRVVCPAGSFGRLMPVMRYFCENGIGPGRWLEVLDELRQPYRPLGMVSNAGQFVSFAEFEPTNLLQNTELTQSV